MVVPFGDEAAQHAAVPRVVKHLRAGGLILYPTETVFGLGGLIERAPLERLSTLKSRAEEKPFLLLVSDLAQAPGLHWTTAARALAEVFWPGPLTLVLRDTERRYPPGVASSSGGVALRRTPHAGMRILLDALGAPVTSTSANAPGVEPARTAAEAHALLNELPAESDVWLLEGAAGGAAPSTVLDCTGERPRLVRAGAVSIERIREVVHDVEA